MDLSLFRVSGPTVISFSGGRTSGMLLRLTLDAHGGTLPDDCHVVFANTGKEREETLRFVDECSRRWGVPIHWVERAGRNLHREVTYETASRNGEPFAALIRERRFLPHALARFCTVELKLLIVRALMLSLRYSEWANVVGLRADEAPRVAKLAARNDLGEQEWTSMWPLYSAMITKGDVLSFWRAQCFDLALRPGESNCDHCFLRGRRSAERLIRERPEGVEWWAQMETEIGGRFRRDEPQGYRGMVDRVRRLPVVSALPLDLDADDGLAACGCTDRRPARPTPMRAALVPCTCGAFAGEGHALRCDRVFGGEVAA